MAFCKEVDTVILKAINNCYGNLSDYTVPIFTQDCLARLANDFKTTLGRKYEVISIMLNKNEKQFYKSRAKHNRCQWDQTVMYKFFSLMKVRNDHYFPWWELCNYASYYSCGSSSLKLFSGQSIKKNKIARRLRAPNKFADIQKKSTDTLCASGSFGVAIFDNSQNMKSLKF